MSDRPRQKIVMELQQKTLLFPQNEVCMLQSRRTTYKSVGRQPLRSSVSTKGEGGGAERRWTRS